MLSRAATNLLLLALLLLGNSMKVAVAAGPLQGPVRGTIEVAEGEKAEQIVVRVRCRQSGIHGSIGAGDNHAVVNSGESFVVPFVFRGVFPTGCSLQTYHPEYVTAYLALTDDFMQQAGTIRLKSWHRFLDEGPTDPPMHTAYPWPRLEFSQHLRGLLYYYVPAFDDNARSGLSRHVPDLHRLADRVAATGAFGPEPSALDKDLGRLEDAVIYPASATRLHALAEANDANAIEKLAGRNDYAATWKRNGWSPLVTASNRGNTEAAIALIDGGLDVNRQHRLGHGTALKNALSNRHWQTAAALIGRGAAFDLEPFYRAKLAAALCNLAAAGDTAWLQVMLDRGVSANLAASSGYTALMCAVDKNQPEAARLLLDAGVNKDAQATGNRSALSIARRQRNQEMLRLLEQYQKH